MKQQIFILHGGTVFNSYKDYLDYLRRYKINGLGYLKFKDWKNVLEEELSDRFEIIRPNMPCKRNAKYLEWRIWLEKFLPFLRDKIILIGHSLGAIFWLKYLAENNFPVKISQLHLVATPVTKTSEPLGDFVLPDKLDRLVKQVGKIYLYYSQDDPSVPISDLSIIVDKLPTAQKFIFTDRGHFTDKNFPELIENLLKK